MSDKQSQLSQGLSSLFEAPNRTFEIPAYQRAYSWDDDQITQFMHDLRDTQGNTCYLGHYLFEQTSEANTNQLLVIDGQQRLTTCVLFFNVLCQELHKRTDHDDARKQAAKWHEIFLENSDPDSPRQKLKTVEYDNDFLQRLLNGHSLPSQQEDTKSTLLLKKAHDGFQKKIKAAQTTDLLRWGKLVAYADVTHLIVSDKKQAAQLFAFQNDRGKRLTNLEIVKSYLMLQVLLFGQGKQAPQHILPLLEGRFAAIYKSMTRVDLTEDEVLAYYWRSTLGNPYSGESVIESIKQTLGELSSTDRVEWVVKFVRELADAFQDVFEIEQETFEFAKDLHTLSRMSLSYPLLLRAYRDGIDQPTKERLFKFLENITFRYLIRGGRADISSRFRHHFFDKGVNLTNEELNSSINEFKGMLQRGDDWGWQWNDNTLKEQLNTSFYGNAVDNYLLWKYELSISPKDYKRPPSIDYSQLMSNESIEHIAPQTPEHDDENVYLAGYGVYDNTAAPSEGIRSGSWLNSLGNLMLISQSQNSRMGNKPFATKLAVIQSESLLQQHKKLTDFLISKPEITPEEKIIMWDKDAIERRHKHIIERALEIWDLNKI